MFVSFLHKLILCWSRGLGFKIKTASNSRHNNDPIELKIEAVRGPLWAPHVYESIGKEVGYCFGYGAGKLGLLLHNGIKEEYVWKSGDPLRHLFVLPNPVIRVN